MAPQKPRSPFLPIALFACLSGVVWTAYKLWYQPHLHQKRLQEAEEYAEFIFRREQKAREDAIK